MTAQTADCQTRQPDHDGSVLRLVNCWASWPRPAFAKPVNLIAKLYLTTLGSQQRCAQYVHVLAAMHAKYMRKTLLKLET